MPTFVIPNSGSTPLPSNEPQDTEINEAWSPAARAAAAAARGQAGKGRAARTAMARNVFAAAGGARGPLRGAKAKANASKENQQKKWEQEWKKRRAESAIQAQAIRGNELKGRIGDTKRRSAVEKVKVSPRYDWKKSSNPRKADAGRDVKIVRRHADTGKGKSRTYSNITPSSRARLERALGSKRAGYYFTSDAASRWAGGGWHEKRGKTSKGLVSYQAKKK